MDRLMIATDLSTRSEAAIQRGRLLASQFGADALVTHIVDDDQPTLMVQHQQDQAEATLTASCRDFARVRVVAGIPFLGICRCAQEHRAELIVMGSHRKRVLLDVFTGTTIERVVRHSNTPVLMVNREPQGPYARVLAALDLSEHARHALVSAAALGLLVGTELHAVHALDDPVNTQMVFAGVDEKTIHEHTSRRLEAARKAVSRSLETAPLDKLEMTLHVAQGLAFEVVRDTALQQKADLVVIGTRGSGGLKHLFLGSVADQALRSLDCDVLVVPPPG